MTENQTHLKTLLEAINTDSVQSFKARCLDMTTTYIRRNSVKYSRHNGRFYDTQWATRTVWDAGKEHTGTEQTNLIKLDINRVLENKEDEKYFTLLEMHLKF